MTKVGQAELCETFSHNTTDVFQMLFGDEMFVKFHTNEKRGGVQITQSWRRVPGGTHTEYEREGTYSYIESRVLKQGPSQVRVREVATKDSQSKWTVTSSFTNSGGPLATSTVVKATYRIEPLDGHSCTVSCVIKYQYDLSSVSWVLRPAVDLVVSSEMKGIPRRMFAFALSNPCSGNAADVILYIDNSSGSVDLLDECTNDDGDDEIDKPHPAATTSDSGRPNNESEHVAVSVGTAAGSGAVSQCSPSSRRLSVSIKSPHTPESEHLINSPALRNNSSTASITKRRGKSLILITVIFVFWMSAAMVGSSG